MASLVSLKTMGNARLNGLTPPGGFLNLQTNFNP